MNRVAIYRNVLLPRSETFVRDQAKALRAWKPTLVGNFRMHDGLDLSGLPVLVPEGSASRRRFRQRAGLPDPALAQALKASADLVHVHFGPDAVDVWPSVKRAGLSMLVTLHGYDIATHKSWWWSARGGLTRIVYPGRLARLFREPRVGFLAVSDAIRARAVDFGVPPEKIVTRRIGIDVRKFRPASTLAGARTRRVLFVGRLVEKKGVRYLIEAMARIRADVPGATLAIVGDGPLRTPLAALAVERGVPTEFLGTLDDAGVRAQLETARAFCLPSVVAASGDAEGFGMVLLEAQACGVPVVTSARGGATEGLLEGKTGFSFSERDVDALSTALATLLSDDELANRMSQLAPDFVRDNFDINLLTPALEAVYDHAATAELVQPGAMQCLPS